MFFCHITGTHWNAVSNLSYVNWCKNDLLKVVVCTTIATFWFLSKQSFISPARLVLPLLVVLLGIIIQSCSLQVNRSIPFYILIFLPVLHFSRLSNSQKISTHTLNLCGTIFKINANPGRTCRDWVDFARKVLGVATKQKLEVRQGLQSLYLLTVWSLTNLLPGIGFFNNYRPQITRLQIQDQRCQNEHYYQKTKIMAHCQESTNPLDGCTHVFIDLSSNNRPQIRKLIEPQLFPGDPILPVYQRWPRWCPIKFLGIIHTNIRNLLTQVFWSPWKEESRQCLCTSVPARQCWQSWQFWRSPESPCRRLFNLWHKSNPMIFWKASCICSRCL